MEFNLEFNPVTYVAHTQWAIGAKDDLFLEHLHPVLEIASRQQHISSYQLMLRFIYKVLQILFPGNFHLLSVSLNFHCDLHYSN